MTDRTQGPPARSPSSQRSRLQTRFDGGRAAAVSNEQLLVREVRHRVTNSLQLVASALLLSALASRSEEARSHLHSAHSRIMAVAELERRLCNLSTESVDVRDYLVGLCADLSSSVIIDGSRVKIAVFAASALATAGTASSLGMIVAELVTNAQKYAFPEGRSGKISVRYEPRLHGWRLQVSDDGVGIGETPPKPGLGTEIVRALSQQLGAEVATEKGEAGLTVSVSYPAVERPPRRPFAPRPHRSLGTG